MGWGQKITDKRGVSQPFSSLIFFTIAKIKKVLAPFDFDSSILQCFFRPFYSFLKVKIFFAFFIYFSPIYILSFLLFCICSFYCFLLKLLFP